MPRKKRHGRLEVLTQGVRIGTLTRASTGTYEFSYSDEWLASKVSFPVSWSLQLRAGAFRGETVAAFFDNLLPDNDAIRDRIAQRFATPGKGTLDLLAAIGRDCVGALQFVPEGEKVGNANLIETEPLSEREIGEILRNLKVSPLGLDREKAFRISLAGAQEKTALLRWRGQWHRPLGPTPTSHILKPSMGALPNGIDMKESVANEWLCLKLCEHLGLPVAQADIAEFDGRECLVVERFDRAWSSDKRSLRRIHQEDMCQALGVPWSRKYQSDGGPGIIQIMEFLNGSDFPAPDRRQFIRSQLVFWLLGAIDGHAKNFSIRLSQTGFRLTPIYDVMSILPALAKRQLEPKEAKLAMSAGNNRHYRLRELRRRHWEQTAKAASFPLPDLHALLDDLGSRVEKLDSVLGPLAKQAPASVLNAITAGVRKNMKLLGTVPSG